jgi:hypothetical protein
MLARRRRKRAEGYQYCLPRADRTRQIHVTGLYPKCFFASINRVRGTRIGSAIRVVPAPIVSTQRGVINHPFDPAEIILSIMRGLREPAGLNRQCEPDLRLAGSGRPAA